MSQNSKNFNQEQNEVVIKENSSNGSEVIPKCVQKFLEK